MTENGNVPEEEKNQSEQEQTRTTRSGLSYAIGFYTNLKPSNKSWREISRAMRTVKIAFIRAERRLFRLLKRYFDGYPFGMRGHLQISVNVDDEEVDNAGGVFSPENKELHVNKYVFPLCEDGAHLDMRNMLKNRRLLEHTVTHELIHFAFTEYKYDGESDVPVGWTVGLCPPENVGEYIDFSADAKWITGGWLDEILTERLALHVSGYKKTGALVRGYNVSDGDKAFYDKVMEKLRVGPVSLESILSALYYHDKKYFIE